MTLLSYGYAQQRTGEEVSGKPMMLYFHFDRVLVDSSYMDNSRTFRHMDQLFTILSIITIILSSVLTDLLPDLGLTQDPLLNCVFGGILYAFGSSLCLRADATTGGTDFIAMYMAQKHDRDAFGTIFIFNAIMLAVAGYLFGWDKELCHLFGISIGC